MALKEKELLLLSNLMYSSGHLAQGKSVGEVVDKIMKSDEYETFSDDKKKVFEAIKNDPDLTSLKIAKLTPQYSDVHAACFVDKAGNATVAFEGTGGTQFAWNDNVQGENKSDTLCQRQAEVFIKDVCGEYDNITVTGHSKGSNMAMYTAILCPSVSRCVGFDGQGFSDEFYAKYADQVSANSYKVTNICACNDYVNPLLKPINQNKYVNNNTNGNPVAGHFPESLYVTNSGDHPYDDFGEDQYVAQEPIFKGEHGMVNILGHWLDGQGGSFHQLTVDVLATVVAYAFAHGEYSFGQMIGDLKSAVDRFLGVNQHYFYNAEYTVDLGGLDRSSESLDSIASALSGQNDELTRIHSQFKPTSSSMRVEKFLLKRAIGESEKLKNDIVKMARGLYGIRQLYTSVELRVADLSNV